MLGNYDNVFVFIECDITPEELRKVFLYVQQVLECNI